ncbi:hypothetical protein niasHS_018083 [Heterodera schachtii]|uniref:Ubiquitin-like domain-containing protein n=1 Tax=Heterodera schachtii TaxID=97005 RepID=A0ABD2HT32_HETSC
MRASSASKNEGTTISVDLKSEQTVADLKQAIKKETDIPPEQQLIRHNSPSGYVLEDGETLENGGLEKADVFLSFGELEIRVHNGTEMFASRVDKTDTVATLKKAIKEKFGIPSEKQTLRLNNTFGLALEDAKTMEEYGIKDGQTILWSLGEFQIKLKYVEVNAEYTVKIVKEKIKAIIGQLCEHFNRKETEMELRKKDRDGEILDNDNETIEESGIKEEGDQVYANCSF